MISIIVSSYKEEFFNQFIDSVKETIGLEYEIIKIHNPNLMGICEAYNLGVSKSKFDIVLFSHEDVIFRSQNWGREIVAIFNSDSEIGLIGLAGCKIKSYVPSGWYTEKDQYLAYNFIQSDYNKKADDSIVFKNINELTEVATVDGFFMATKRDLVLSRPFDTKLLKGFHAYDLDFSLGIGQNNKIVISHLIKVEHCSLGCADKYWFEDILKINEKYKGILPVYTNGLKKNKIIEYDNLKFLLRYAKSNKIDSQKSTELIYKYYKKIGFLNFIKIIIYLIYINFDTKIHTL